MLNLIRALVFSLIMFVSIPLIQAGGPIYPPADTQPRAVEAFISSESGVNVGTAATVLARVRGLYTNTFLMGEELRIQMNGGDSELASTTTSGYIRKNASGSTIMDHICYSRTTGTEAGNLINRSSGNFAAVMIASYGQPCAAGFVDTGWYMAKMYAPMTIEYDQNQNLRITDLSIEAQPSMDIRTTVVNRFTNHLAQVQFLPLSPNVAMGSDMPVILFASDEHGIGISCSPGGSGFESDTDSGCSLARNGYDVGNNAININQSTLSSNSLGTLSMSGLDISGLKLLSRAGIKSKSLTPLSVSNLGGGAYMVVIRGGSTLSSGYASINATDNSGVALVVPSIRLSTVSRTWSF